MRGSCRLGSQCEKRSSRRKRCHSSAAAPGLPKDSTCSASLHRASNNAYHAKQLSLPLVLPVNERARGLCWHTVSKCKSPAEGAERHVQCSIKDSRVQLCWQQHKLAACGCVHAWRRGSLLAQPWPRPAAQPSHWQLHQGKLTAAPPLMLHCCCQAPPRLQSQPACTCNSAFDVQPDNLELVQPWTRPAAQPSRWLSL